MGTAAAGRVARWRPRARPRQGLSAIYHIAARGDWEAAQQRGAYRAPSLDTEGFIHCSTAVQVCGVANAFYGGRHDLVLLRLDPALLGDAVRFESPVDPRTGTTDARATDRFPHVYGAIELAAVVAVADFAPDADGRFTFPAALR
jgi:uncharacterized protein (DUF952 family)